MPDPNLDQLHNELSGTISRVDPVSREIEVRVGDSSVTFDVRCDSVITLREERVKLRLIQPRDQVRVRYRKERNALVADLIEVQTHHPAIAR